MKAPSDRPKTSCLPQSEAGSSWPTLGDPLTALWLGADDALRWSVRCASVLGATGAGAAHIEGLRRQRLTTLVAHARRNSSLMREVLGTLPDDAPLTSLPITERDQLMQEFDRWVTDPRVRLDEVRGFLADPQRTGEPYLGRYAIWTSSGTSGMPGIFVSDPDALAVYEALWSARSACGHAATPLWQAMLGGCRIAMVAATTGHFAGVVTWERMRRLHPWLNLTSRIFSILDPIDRLVEGLNAWQPAVISSYPSLLALLAEAKRAGRLKLAPSLLMSGGETLPGSQARVLQEAFNCPVRDEYGASECMNIAWSCPAGVLHLNADWVILEPVDEHMRPVPPGTPSSDVLLTNLANHVQPILRHRLGDRVTLLPGRCECGCPLPRMQVIGRNDEVLHLPDTRGRPVAILPLALEALIEEHSSVGCFQVEQTAANRLSIRLQTCPPDERQTVWQALEQRIGHWLALQGACATVVLDPRAPEPDPKTGKLRRVIGLDRPSGGRLTRPGRPDGHAQPRTPRGSGQRSRGR